MNKLFKMFLGALAIVPVWSFCWPTFEGIDARKISDQLDVVMEDETGRVIARLRGGEEYKIAQAGIGASWNRQHFVFKVMKGSSLIGQVELAVFNDKGSGGKESENFVKLSKMDLNGKIGDEIVRLGNDPKNVWVTLSIELLGKLLR